ncbi:MAG TPA: hypothetical protein VIM77_14090, partial [Mucilaginibacter sp.]
NTAAAQLARQQINFKEIAGNTGAIMLTVLTNKPLTPDKNYSLLFTQPIFTQPGMNRMAIVTTVENLSGLINWLQNNKVIIEHIYDY